MVILPYLCINKNENDNAVITFKTYNYEEVYIFYHRNDNSCIRKRYELRTGTQRGSLPH